MLVVADASVVVEYLLGSRLGGRAAATIEDPAVDLHAPALCDIEVASAMRGLLNAKKLALARAREAMEDYAALPVIRHGHLALLDRVLALRDNFSAYDAAYVALAERLAAHLLTSDEPLANAVRAHLPLLPVEAVI